MSLKTFADLEKEVPEDVNRYKDFFEVVKEKEVLLFSKRGHTEGNIVKHVIKQKEANQPFYIVDLCEILERFKEWEAGLPRVQPYYAVKCCPDPMIVKVLAKLGCGFDCASEAEVMTVLGEGVSPDKIIYANTIKDPLYLKFAKEKNVNLMTFDNEAELHKIKKIHPKANIVLRLKAHDEHSGSKFSGKFGCSVKDGKEFLKMAKDLDLNVIGVSFHVGSRCADVSSYTKALKEAKEIFDAAEELGMKMTLLDLGGGFPGPTDESKLTFEEMAKEINGGLEKHFSHISDLKIIGEPGRYFAAKAYCLVFSVIGKRPDPDHHFRQRWEYYMNDGIYGSFNSVFFDHAKPIIKALDEKDGKKHKCIVFGPTCDGVDKITDEAELPHLEIGDWCFVEHFGAYTRAAASTFNGFPKPELYYAYLY